MARLPASPPLPTCCRRLFQSAFGSHTSNRMFESLVGRMTPVTRQDAGRLGNTSPEGKVNVPAGIDCVLVIVVSGKASEARSSQVLANVACPKPAHASSVVTAAALSAHR